MLKINVPKIRPGEPHGAATINTPPLVEIFSADEK